MSVPLPGVTVASTLPWFVACQYTRLQNVGGELVPRPLSVCHAKQMGGTVTTCGLRATSLTKLFHVGFPTAGSDNCARCLQLVGEQRTNGHRPTRRG
jgi:hypothetical protein